MNASSFWEGLANTEQSMVLWLVYGILSNVNFVTTVAAPVALSWL